MGFCGKFPAFTQDAFAAGFHAGKKFLLFFALCICHSQAASAIWGIAMFDSVFFMALYPVFVSFAFFADMVVEELELDVGAVLVFPSFFFFDGVVVRAKECFALFGSV